MAVDVLRFGSYAAIAAACVACAPSPPPPAQAIAGETPSFGSDETSDEVAGELAVDLRDDLTDAEIQRLASQYGIAPHAASVWSARGDKLEVVDVDPAREPSLLDALARDPRVERAEPMALYREAFVPDDPLYATKQWHLGRVGAERAWDYSCGRGVTVAVVDTGIACFDDGPFSRGTDLAGTRCEGGWNFVADSPHAADDQGHGTHVAGTIAQTTNNGVGAAGLAFCATLMPVKVLNRQGFGTTANVAEGIRYAADHGAQIINLSLGGPIKSRILEDAVAHAVEKGVLVVAAAGNTGRGVGWPAAYPGVVAVSATDDRDAIAAFSSRGPQIAIAAPGVAVTQQTICNAGRDRCEIFGTYNGTSMASPHVAGVAALVESLGATRAEAAFAALASTARPKDAPALYGAGVLDGGRAVARTYWTRVAERLVALLALAWVVVRRIRRKGAAVSRSRASRVAALAAAVGIFPLWPLVAPLLHVVPLTRWGALGDLAMRPFGEWDLPLFGAAVHRWMPFASALPAVVLSALAFRHRRFRPVIGGIALGSAALVAQVAWAGDAAFAFGPGALRLWAVANALVCVWIARVGLERA